MRTHRRRCLLLLLAGTVPAMPVRADDEAAHVAVMLEDFAPYSFTDEQGQPTGYAVELAREMLARARVGASFEFSSWPRVMLRARSEPNVLLPAIVRLTEREAMFHWLGQIGIRRGMLFRLKTRPEVQPKTLAEARAWRIGVLKDDVAERELSSLGLVLGETLDRASDYPALLRRFFAGRDDLLALSNQIAPAILRRHGYDPQLIEPVLKFSDSRPHVALSLRTPEPLRQRLMKAWDTMRRDGTVAAIAAKYPGIGLE